MVKFAEDSDNTEINRQVLESSGASSPEANGSTHKAVNGEEGKKKRKHRDKTSKNGRSIKKRRHSMSKAARDPRDEASPVEDAGTRSPSPVIDFDGLSRPSKSNVLPVFNCPWKAYADFIGLGTRERLEESPDQAKARLDKLSGAVRTILECLGEDPSREGLLGTPERYAKAMLFFTKGYQENVRDIVNGAIFHEGHNELVIVKDIEVFSLCEHHMVPFTGKVRKSLPKSVT
jgi:GTP cyclohydrolase I